MTESVGMSTNESAGANVAPNKPLQPTRAAWRLRQREAARCGPRG